MSVPPKHLRPLPDVDISERGLRQLEIWLRQRPQLEWEDVGAAAGTGTGTGGNGGGAEPDYISTQTAISITDSFGVPTYQPVLHWAEITVTDIQAHIHAGLDLYAHMTADVTGVEVLVLQLLVGGASLLSPTIPPADWGIWTHVDVAGMLLSPAYTGLADTMTAQIVSQSSRPAVTVDAGVYTLTWVPTGTVP